MTPLLPQLLVDTDAFCKLAAADLLDDVLALLGVSREQCAVLPALPHMLGKGPLRMRYGDATADGLRRLTGEFPVAPGASEEWLDMLAAVPRIDPGEAQLFALAAEHGIRVLTGDKRALEALARVNSIHPHLEGRIVSLEAALAGLTKEKPEAQLRQKGTILAQYDQMARAIFASTGTDLGEALDSYMRDLESKVKPLVLWRHRE